MASKLPARAFAAVTRPTRQRCGYLASSQHQTLRQTFSTNSPKHELETESSNRPRWQYTPAAMVAPVRTSERPAPPPYPVNNDPVELDKMYIRMLGEGGDKLLSEETKWLAVTHKSFDHGRRGFNDRLAYLGKRIVDLQTSLAIIERDSKSPATSAIPTPLDALDGLSDSSKAAIIDFKKLAKLSSRYDLESVLRWKPRKASNLLGSGVDVVLAQAMYAIVGAVALEKGGAVANQIVKSKILRPLGLNIDS